MSPYQLFFEGFSAFEGGYEDSSNIDTSGSVSERIGALQASIADGVDSFVL